VENVEKRSREKVVTKPRKCDAVIYREPAGVSSRQPKVRCSSPL